MLTLVAPATVIATAAYVTISRLIATGVSRHRVVILVTMAALLYLTSIALLLYTQPQKRLLILCLVLFMPYL